MRKILWSLLSMIIMLSSCNNEEDLTTPTNQTQKKNVDNHFYGVKTPSEATTKGVAQKDKLWYNGTTIKVKFLNGTKDYKQKVQTYVQEWEQYANIKFDFVENEKAQVRIGFDWNDQRYITWSYTGTDCKYERNQNEATMSFAYWDSSSEDEIKGDVLRAFGQVLGLELEHRHLEFDPGWTAKIADYWEGEMEDATWEDLKEYVFDPLDVTNIIQTREYDVNSIMVWPFSKKYAKNTARDFNYELSDRDIEFIKQVYPKVEDPIVTWKPIKNEFQNIGFRLDIQKEITIDWGDGIKETIMPKTDLFVEHKYKNGKDYNSINIYGSIDALLALEITSNSPIEGALYVEKSKELQSLSCSGQALFDLNLSNNKKLKHLNCANNELKYLNISNCTELETLSCNNNLLEELDISNNSELVSLDCNNNPLTSLDISNNKQLMKLYCNGCLLPSLDISKNEQLYRIVCYNNPFITNYDEMMNIASNLRYANQLPDWTHIEVRNETTKSWIQDLCNSKGWDLQ